MSDEAQTEPQPTPTFADLIKQADEKISSTSNIVTSDSAMPDGTKGVSGIPESNTPEIPQPIQREVEAVKEAVASDAISGDTAENTTVDVTSLKDKRLKADLVVENESLRHELAAIKVELASRPPIVMHGDTPVGNFDNLKVQNEVANADAPTPLTTPQGSGVFSILQESEKIEEELALKLHEAYEDHKPSWLPSFTWDALEKEMGQMFYGMAHAAVHHLFGSSGIPENDATGGA